MPQLDYLTYCSQFVWFLIFFSLVYFRTTITFLPKIAQIHKIRIKSKKDDINRIKKLEQNHLEQKKEDEQIIKNKIKTTNQQIAKKVNQYETITQKIFQQTNNKKFKNANQLYINTIIKNLLNRYLIESTLKN